MSPDDFRPGTYFYTPDKFHVTDLTRRWFYLVMTTNTDNNINVLSCRVNEMYNNIDVIKMINGCDCYLSTPEEYAAHESVRFIQEAAGYDS